jgi:ribosomal protein S18 acetylase RimI-like enzyme
MPESLRLVRDLTGLPSTGAVSWPTDVRLVPFGARLALPAYELLKAAYANGYGSVPVSFDGWWASTRHDPEFDAGLCLCATLDQRLVGFALCWTSGFVKDIAVAALHRRRGIGEGLLRSACAVLSQRGIAQLALKVHRDNAVARQLYARLGFREVD